MRPKAILICLLIGITSGAALGFIQIDDTNVQKILTGAIKTFQDAIRFQATGGGSTYVGFVAPAVVNTPSVTYKFPPNDGTNGQVWSTDGNANISWATVSGSGVCPGGSSTQFQWNNAAVCAGTTGMTWDTSQDGWTLAGGVLPLDGSKYWIHETGTFTGTAANTPTPAAGQVANFTDITGNGVGNYQIVNQVRLGAGYTGTNDTFTERILNNSVPSAASTPYPININSHLPGATGSYTSSVGTAAGSLIGQQVDIENSGSGAAVAYYANAPTNHAGPNFGFMANANLDGGNAFPLYGILTGGGSTPTLLTSTNAAVVGDVWATNGDIFLGLEHGVPVFRASRATGTAINGVQFLSANTANEPSMNAISSGGSPDTNVSYDINAKGTGAVKIKHPGGGGTPFTAGAITCGTSPDLHGTDSAFQITMGSGSNSSCTFSWKSTWNHAPACACSNETTPGNTIAIQATTTTATIVGTKVGADLIDCVCASWTD